MKNVRRWHLFLSCFFAPMLLFYVVTGWYQTLSQDRNKNSAEAQTLRAKLTSIHVDQIYPSEKAESFSPTLFKILVVLMSISLIVTLALGIYLAFNVGRPRWAVWVSLVLGIILPIAALWLGQSRVAP
jgi:hypothetical protein